MWIIKTLGDRAAAPLVDPEAPDSDDRLRREHTKAYPDTLTTAIEASARALELPHSLGCCPVRC